MSKFFQTKCFQQLRTMHKHAYHSHQMNLHQPFFSSFSILKRKFVVKKTTRVWQDLNQKIFERRSSSEILHVHLTLKYPGSSVENTWTFFHSPVFTIKTQTTSFLILSNGHTWTSVLIMTIAPTASTQMQNVSRISFKFHSKDIIYFWIQHELAGTVEISDRSSTHLYDCCRIITYRIVYWASFKISKKTSWDYVVHVVHGLDFTVRMHKHQ
jgi:hypothetical protein